MARGRSTKNISDMMRWIRTSWSSIKNYLSLHRGAVAGVKAKVAGAVADLHRPEARVRVQCAFGTRDPVAVEPRVCVRVWASGLNWHRGFRMRFTV